MLLACTPDNTTTIRKRPRSMLVMLHTPCIPLYTPHLPASTVRGSCIGAVATTISVTDYSAFDADKVCDRQIMGST
jgi:hypothetical protein